MPAFVSFFHDSLNLWALRSLFGASWNGTSRRSGRNPMDATTRIKESGSLPVQRVSIPYMDPWEWYIYRHLDEFYIVNASKQSIHGSYGILYHYFCPQIFQIVQIFGGIWTEQTYLISPFSGAKT